MKKPKVLFVSQEIFPYLESSHIADISRYLPQGIQDKGKDIRTFMPRFGCINERRHQLHEVIRLSGMNLIIDNMDHPLIIKVASIQAARMQVYFIDNEEYFKRKTTFADENGQFFQDNDDRSIFFCRGVLETVKKLNWSPDIIHCHGWMTSLLPFLIKTSYKDDPVFKNTKLVYSVYNDGFAEPFADNFAKKLNMEGMTAEELKAYSAPSFVNITKAAIDMSDAVIQGAEKIEDEISLHISKIDKPSLAFKTAEEYVDAYSSLYDELLEEEVLAQ